jgi:hypothetical protein
MSYPPNLAATWPHGTHVLHQHCDFLTSIVTVILSVTIDARRVPPVDVSRLAVGLVPHSRGPPRTERISVSLHQRSSLFRVNRLPPFASDDSSRLSLRCNDTVRSEVGPLPTFRDHTRSAPFWGLPNLRP